MAAKQSKLFGRTVAKEPFFKCSQSNSRYFEVVNALWQLDEDNKGRFIKLAQRQWKEIYANDEEACARLLARAEERAHGGKRLSAAFVVVGGDPSPAPRTSSRSSR